MERLFRGEAYRPYRLRYIICFYKILLFSPRAIFCIIPQKSRKRQFYNLLIKKQQASDLIFYNI
ncbi:MAG: hypothetical protein LBH59_07510 [Planctomycetaceae bacterium]|nr:hypothetical protein [Planctomycetaceae bacterium]